MDTKRNRAGHVRRTSPNAHRGRKSSTLYSYYERNSSAGDRAPISYGGEGLSASVNPYSRRVTQADYNQQRKKKKHKTIALVAIVVVLTLMLGGAGAAFAYYQTINANLHEGIDEDLLGNLVDTQYAGEPFYMLLMGSDRSQERENSGDYEGDTYRSDSMILTRIDPEKKQVTMVSLHRDTMINMGVNGTQKLNAAHSIGGPAYTVEVVAKMAGVNISHYAEIDFDGFKEIVDALGGVEVDVPMEINDDLAGGHVAAGLQTLNGDQALILCRSRHSYDEFGDGDRYRAANQRLVLAAIAKKLLSSDPATMVSTVEALSRYVTTDLDVTEIVGLAQNLRGIDTENAIYTAMEPTISEYADETWYENLDVVAWKEMMRRVNQGLSPTAVDEIDPLTGTVLAGTGNGNKTATSSSSTSSTQSNSGTRSGTVDVRNGTDVSGLGARAASMVSTLGYSAEAGNASSSDYENSIVVYNDISQSEAANEIAQLLGISSTFQNDGAYSFGTDFLVVIGADWA